MLEGLVLGTIQGISEWLPVSSEGMLALAEIHLFGATDLMAAVRLALFLHLGTFFAALVYFRKDVYRLLVALVNYKTAKESERSLLRFLIIATLISGTLGLVLLKLIEGVLTFTESTGGVLTIGIGILLSITAYLQIKQKNNLARHESETTLLDSVALGVTQGFAALPGLSRSGLTVAALMMRGFTSESALRLSFLMSLPIVLAGNIVLNFSGAIITAPMLIGLVFSFIFGLATIHGLLLFTRRINIGLFVLVFAILMIFSGVLLLK